MKNKCMIVMALLMAFLLTACQVTSDMETADSAETTPTFQTASPETQAQTSPAETEPAEDSTSPVVSHDTESSEDTRSLYEPTTDFVLSLAEDSYPVDVDYIDVTVTATRPGYELNVSMSYDIFKVENGELIHLGYGGGAVAAVYTPDDPSSFAEGSIRVDLVAFQKNYETILAAGEYRIRIDGQFVDVTLTAD